MKTELSDYEQFYNRSRYFRFLLWKEGIKLSITEWVWSTFPNYMERRRLRRIAKEQV